MRKVVVASLLAFCVAGILASRLLSWKGAETSSTPNLGRPIADFSLKDTKGQEVALSSFKGKKTVVVLFLGTECPINNAYLPRLAELHKSYDAQGVQFLGINSNQQEAPPRVAEHSRQYEIPFPVLKDDGN